MRSPCTSAQAKYLLHNLEKAAKGIGLYVNTDEVDFICFKEDSDLFTYDDKPMKFVEYFTYLSSNISSTGRDVDICTRKAWTAINRLSIKWISAKKMGILPTGSSVNTIVWLHHMNIDKVFKEKLDENNKRMLQAI